MAKQLFYFWIKKFLLTDTGIRVLSQYLIYRVRRDTPRQLIKKRGESSVLLLSPERFVESEIQDLSDCGSINIFFLDKQLLHLLINIVWNHNVPLAATLEPNTSSYDRELLQSNRRAVRELYSRILPIIFRRFRIRAVAGSAPHYGWNHDFGAIASKMGIPYVILMKECLITNQRHHDRIVNYYSKMERDVIGHVIVYNRSAESAFLASGLVTKDRISVLGCIRMDRYLRKIRSGYVESRSQKKPRKQVVVFGFIHGVGLYGWVPAMPPTGGPGFFRLFSGLHEAIGTLALKRSDVDFVVKVKWPGPYPRDQILECFERVGASVDLMPNLSVTADVDAQTLIFSSHVVVSFGSTTMLEAAIARKPVIVPHFAEAIDEAYSGYIQLKDTYSVYDVARSAEHLVELIEHRLENDRISNDTYRQRERYFEEYVSTLDGDATGRYASKLRELMGGAGKPLN